MKNNDIPAFPIPAFRDVLPKFQDDNLSHDQQSGMTLRDYFAAAALQGFCSQMLLADPGARTSIANRCYLLADAMLHMRTLDLNKPRTADEL